MSVVGRVESICYLRNKPSNRRDNRLQITGAFKEPQRKIGHMLCDWLILINKFIKINTSLHLL